MSSRKKSQLHEKVRISRNFDFIADSAESIFFRESRPLCSVSGTRLGSWKLPFWRVSAVSEDWNDGGCWKDCWCDARKWGDGSPSGGLRATRVWLGRGGRTSGGNSRR